MPGTLYRIKLYGHSGGDTELFCKNLATILDIDEQRARALLRDTPAIIKEGMEKAKAEEFCKLLEPIRALCIVEPLGGEIGEDLSSVTAASTRLSQSPEADDLKKKAFGSRIWTVALVVTIGAFLVFVGGGFISSFWSLYRHNQPPAAAPAPVESQAESSSDDAGPVSVEELQVQIDELEARIESSRFHLAQAEEARGRLLGSPHSQSKDLEEQGLIMRDLRDQIRRDAAQLKILKRRLEEIE